VYRDFPDCLNDTVPEEKLLSGYLKARFCPLEIKTDPIGIVEQK